LTAIDTWKFNKVLGNGIKSFREVCHQLGEMPDINLEERVYNNNIPLAPEEVTYFNKKNRLCSNHPHNYYLEILTETGIVGLVIISIIALLFISFLFKNNKFIKQIRVENFILLAAIISLIIETIPLRSSGSLFTTNNATYLILIGSIILSYKTILKIKIE
jgi:O-antigen ligase